MKKNVKYVEMTSPFLEVLGVASSAFILWYGGSQVLSGEISQGTFLAFIVALFMMYTPIRILFKIMASIQTSLAGAERVFEILDLPEEKVREGQKELIDFQGKIEFKDADYSEIVNYLANERNFSRERVQTSVNRLKQSLVNRSHTLEQWF